MQKNYFHWENEDEGRGLYTSIIDWGKRPRQKVRIQLWRSFFQFRGCVKKTDNFGDFFAIIFAEIKKTLLYNFLLQFFFLKWIFLELTNQISLLSTVSQKVCLELKGENFRPQ